jgi:hypothetical protein
MEKVKNNMYQYVRNIVQNVVDLNGKEFVVGTKKNVSRSQEIYYMITMLRLNISRESLDALQGRSRPNILGFTFAQFP